MRYLQSDVTGEISVGSSKPCGTILYSGSHLSERDSESLASYLLTQSDDFDQFIKFVNMLMSDTTFHLEESLTGLSKIHSIQTQRSNEASWAALPQAEREDLDSQLRQAENSAPFHTQLGLDHVHLIRDFTATTAEPFVTAEIIDRLAAVGLLC